MQTQRELEHREPKTRLEAVSDLTNAAEFMLTTIRAISLGHPVESKHVQDPIKWALDILEELTT